MVYPNDVLSIERSAEITAPEDDGENPDDVELPGHQGRVESATVVAPMLSRESRDITGC